MMNTFILFFIIVSILYYGSVVVRYMFYKHIIILCSIYLYIPTYLRYTKKQLLRVIFRIYSPSRKLEGDPRKHVPSS